MQPHRRQLGLLLRASAPSSRAAATEGEASLACTSPATACLDTARDWVGRDVVRARVEHRVVGAWPRTRQGAGAPYLASKLSHGPRACRPAGVINISSSPERTLATKPFENHGAHGAAGVGRAGDRMAPNSTRPLRTRWQATGGGAGQMRALPCRAADTLAAGLYVQMRHGAGATCARPGPETSPALRGPPDR